MKAAALQMTSSPDVAANLEQAGVLLKQAREQGAALAVLPENFAFMGLNASTTSSPSAKPTAAGPSRISCRARRSELSLWIVAGTMPLRVEGESRVAPASLVFNAKGERVARYDKIHLFDVDVPGRRESYRESATMAPGSAACVSRHADRPARSRGLLRHALPGALPPA